MKIEPKLTSFLLTQGGPILRWLTAVELATDDPTIDREVLKTDLLGCAEVRQLIGLLGSGPVHHSKDSSAENVLARLCEYGLRAGVPDLDEHALPYCALGLGERFGDQALILAAFLVRLGYAGETSVANWMAQRINLLYELACRGDYDLYMDEIERRCLPPGQQTPAGRAKRFYKLRFNDHWGVLGLPTCYDLYALAYLPKQDAATQLKVESIIIYLLNPAFQQSPGGYIWNPQLHRAYTAGRVFLACLPGQDQPEKLVLFLEMMTQFEPGRSSEWFARGMAHLESFRTPRGTYCFPRNYLSEKHSYYLYAGMHMGLGEWPRNVHALELESTFRMLRLQRLTDAAGIHPDD
jgi:hypothetical protein